MKNPQETARRWLAQAEYSLQVTQTLLASNLWAAVCFHAEQTAQLALKAYLFGQGHRVVTIRAISVLVAECGKHDAAFLELAEPGLILDRYYLATRYPDALPAPALPYQSFTAAEGRQAWLFANKIVELCRTKLA